jgi:mercuric ion transport protein
MYRIEPKINDHSSPVGAQALSGLGMIVGVGAFIGASCCALPILLGSIGLGGGWIATLSPFIAYRGVIIGVASVVIAVGWWLALTRRSKGSVYGLLGIATAIVISAILLSIYEVDVTRFLVSWRR